jgi:hypothetical protein
MHRRPGVLPIFACLLLPFLLLPPRLVAQSGSYHSPRQFAEALETLRRDFPRLLQILAIAQTPGGNPLQAIRLGAGATVDTRPALLIIAGAQGPHLVGSEIALGSLTTLVRAYGTDTAITRLLDEKTVYLIPRANPDAAQGLFDRPASERQRNGDRFDDDRDGSVDEDGPDDLNGDGVITLMRVSDPAGEWLSDPDEPWLMRKAAAGRGESGSYRVYEEGRDNDNDERWNEDPTGGVDVSRNFPYGYEPFGPGAGLHTVATAEVRAIAQFYADHPNIAAVYVIGPQDNLIKPWEYKKESGPTDGPPKPLTSILEGDDPYFAEVARRFQKTTGWEKGPASAELKGDPLSFAYFHMGRWAWGSRGWWVPELPADTAKTAPKPDPKDPVRDERNALRWLRQHNPGAIVEWTEVALPDFEGRKVEVGGFRPGALLNPPDSLLDSLTVKHAKFIQQLAGMLPSVSLRGIKVERVSAQVFRITASVANEGYLPTSSQLGVRVRWPQRVRLELKTDGQQISGGRAVQLLDPIPGNGSSREFTWLVVGRPDSRVTLTATSPVAGAATQTITLR